MKKSVPYHIRQQVFARDGLVCYRCKREVAPGKKRRGLPLATIDHYVPRCAGGTDDLDNLKTCCSRCNQRKGGKIPK